jgi:hypothetical protein
MTCIAGDIVPEQPVSNLGHVMSPYEDWHLLQIDLIDENE